MYEKFKKANKQSYCTVKTVLTNWFFLKKRCNYWIQSPAFYVAFNKFVPEIYIKIQRLGNFKPLLKIYSNTRRTNTLKDGISHESVEGNGLSGNRPMCTVKWLLTKATNVVFWVKERNKVSHCPLFIETKEKTLTLLHIKNSSQFVINLYIKGKSTNFQKWIEYLRMTVIIY